jgi:hypothetical protein
VAAFRAFPSGSGCRERSRKSVCADPYATASAADIGSAANWKLGFPLLFCLITGLKWISAYLLYRFVEMPGRRLIQQLFSGRAVYSVSFLKTR